MTGNDAGSRTKRLLDVIPVAGKKINEPSIAAVAKSNVNDLRETAKMHLQQAGIVALDLSQLDEPAIKAEWYDAAGNQAIAQIIANKIVADGPLR